MKGKGSQIPTSQSQQRIRKTMSWCRAGVEPEPQRDR